MNWFNKISVYISTCLGVGYMPKMPGTFGTMLAVLVYIVLPRQWFSSDMIILAAIMFFSLLVIGIVTASMAEEKLGKDAPAIVIDEFFGFLLGVWLIPRSWMIVVLAFVLFRIFDILKPFPIYQSQRLPKGLGVMADDLLAGVFTNICLRGIIYFFPMIFIF